MVILDKNDKDEGENNGDEKYRSYKNTIMMFTAENGSLQ